MIDEAVRCVVFHKSVTRSHSAIHASVNEHIVTTTHGMGKRTRSAAGSSPAVTWSNEALAAVGLSHVKTLEVMEWIHDEWLTQDLGDERRS